MLASNFTTSDLTATAVSEKQREGHRLPPESRGFPGGLRDPGVWI